MNSSHIRQMRALGFPWTAEDPFLLCAYHNDAYPRGDGAGGLGVPRAGRPAGEDFSHKEGWSMYYGGHVPGFPKHPHRGFETITIVRKGFVDHSDSLGAIARFGLGDVQWLTAGKGIVHSEMFPLLNTSADNPLELFQIWLNLPRRSKLVEPHFSMFWSDQVPHWSTVDAQGRRAEVGVVAGAFGGLKASSPPPDSWAADPASDLEIWTLKIEGGAELELPAARQQGTRRTLYFFAGEALEVGGQRVADHAAIELDAQAQVRLLALGTDVECLLLQAQPIGEPVARSGLFVMNDPRELEQAMDDFRRTGFGGWPHETSAPVHGPKPQRFSRLPNGQTEKPTSVSDS